MGICKWVSCSGEQIQVQAATSSVYHFCISLTSCRLTHELFTPCFEVRAMIVYDSVAKVVGPKKEAGDLEHLGTESLLRSDEIC